MRARAVDGRVNGAPDGGTARGDDGDDAPVGSEVLHAPDHADQHGCEGEDGAVANADESGDEGEGLRKGLDERCG